VRAEAIEIRSEQRRGKRKKKHGGGPKKWVLQTDVARGETGKNPKGGKPTRAEETVTLGRWGGKKTSTQRGNQGVKTKARAKKKN